MLYKSVEQKLDHEVGFTCGGIETLNKRDSGVLVVHIQVLLHVCDFFGVHKCMFK